MKCATIIKAQEVLQSLRGPRECQNHRGDPDFSDQDVSQPDIFGPGRFAPGHFGL